MGPQSVLKSGPKLRNFLRYKQKIRVFEIASLYGDCMGPGCIGKFNKNNLPEPIDVTDFVFYKAATQKSATLVLSEIVIELEP
jgi:hypothetical protein